LIVDTAAVASLTYLFGRSLLIVKNRTVSLLVHRAVHTFVCASIRSVCCVLHHSFSRRFITGTPSRPASFVVALAAIAHVTILTSLIESAQT